MSIEANTAADALGAGINTRDAAQIAAIYADDIVVWHGATGSAMGKDENVGLLRDIFVLTSEMEYCNIRRHAIDGGVVQQHQLRGKFADGSPLPVLEACLVIMVNNGRITRIDEYFDAASFDEVWSRLDAYRAATAAA